MIGPVRTMTKDDVEAAAQIFFDAVRRVPDSFYNQAQRTAWAPAIPETGKWQQRLSHQHGFVIEDNKKLAGFMTMTSEGMIDLAFVRPDCQRRGLGEKLYTALEALAREIGLIRLTTNASKMARPFFEKHGWHVVRHQNMERSGIMLENYSMTKNLNAPDGNQAISGLVETR